MILREGDFYTTVHINDSGIAIKNQWQIIKYDELRKRFIGIPTRKRQQFYLPVMNDECLCFKGKDLPLLLDTETGRFNGNACMNFITENKTVLKEFIQAENMNDKFTRFDLVFYCTRNRVIETESEPLF